MRGRGAIALTAMLLSCACSAQSDDAADTRDTEVTTDAAETSVSDAAHGLVATILQYREDEVRHELSIKVRNAGAESVRVVDVRLQWEGLEVVGPVVQDHLLGVGQALDLRVPYGDARCTDGFSLDPPSTTSASGDAMLELTDGSTEMVSIPIDVTPARCDAHALGESKKTYVFQVEIDVGDGPEGVIISPDAATEVAMFQVIVDGCRL